MLLHSSSGPQLASTTSPRCPVVGIGASAGGLEALELFFRHLPVPSGAAFVVVQHLDPTHKDALVELLQRDSALPVQQVTDGLRVEPEQVYVIPPNKDLSIVHGVLYLLLPAQPRGLRLPIDFFLRSLALDLGQRSVGVILSGMGSDGTGGLGAIREAGGACFVQTPTSAKFDVMPRSAIDAGLADVVALPEELPARIVEHLQHARPPRAAAAAPPPEAHSALQKILGLLRSATGHDFSLYKSNTLYRRIERRMAIHRIQDLAGYVSYLRDNPKEGELLFAELLIGVTSFFRDPAEWDLLGQEILPELIQACPAGAHLRAWVPACSTGEEAYSLAMLFRETVERLGPAPRVALEIFATDLDPAAITRARQGRYPAAAVADVSPARLSRFFTEEDYGYRVRPEIRDAVIFATQDLLQDPPFTRLDLISCRNLLIYLNQESQQKLIPLFHYGLRPGGFLMLGSAETAGPYDDLFAPCNSKSRTYRRLDAPVGVTRLLDFPAAFARAPLRSAELPAGPLAAPPKALSLRSLVEQLLLQRFAPAAVLTSSKGDVLYLSGRTEAYLELPVGKANWNLFAMAREGLRHAIGGAFSQALATHQPVVVTDLTVDSGSGPRVVQVSIEPVSEPAGLRGSVLIAFFDRATPAAAPASKRRSRGAARVAHLEQELLRARAELRSSREEMQTSEQELRSANEELQSTNEELQSSNEELTTSKEEMQSMNEELQTLNHELQAKVDELSRVSNDMKNLLDSTEIAVLFLDESLKVRRYTPAAATLIRLIPGDVGRPLADLATDLDYPALLDDAREVLRTLVFRETAVSGQGQLRYNVRIMPYRTLDNRIDGLVITFAPLEGARPRSPRAVSTERNRR